MSDSVDTSTLNPTIIGQADRRWIFEGIGLLFVLIVLALIFSLINPRFATIANFLNILTQASYYMILSLIHI